MEVRLGFRGGLEVDSEESGGVIALLQGSGVDITLLNFSKCHIHVVVKYTACEWYFTSVYGHLDVAKCEETQSLLKSLSVVEGTPQLVCGDFNEILSNYEKR